MAFDSPAKGKQKPRSPFLLLFLALPAIAFLFLFASLVSINGFSTSCFNSRLSLVRPKKTKHQPTVNENYLYWGYRIDCPGKHCDTCAGLGHQESSLRCALEEALYLNSVVGIAIPHARIARIAIPKSLNDPTMLQIDNIEGSDMDRSWIGWIGRILDRIRSFKF